MNQNFLTSAIALVIANTAQAIPDASNFLFEPSQLSGWWAESYNTDPACGTLNLRTAMKIDAENKRLEIQFDRKWKTELGETDHIGAKIISASSRTLTIQYDGETRRKQNGQLVEWELTLVAPGVYRWRETEWTPGQVNTVVGIRCAN